MCYPKPWDLTMAENYGYLSQSLKVFLVAKGSFVHGHSRPEASDNCCPEEELLPNDL